jgi:hypothetical protein
LNSIVKVQVKSEVVEAVGMWETWSLRKVVHISISPIQALPELHTFTEKDLHYRFIWQLLVRLPYAKMTRQIAGNDRHFFS